MYKSENSKSQGYFFQTPRLFGPTATSKDSENSTIDAKIRRSESLRVKAIFYLTSTLCDFDRISEDSKNPKPENWTTRILSDRNYLPEFHDSRIQLMHPNALRAKARAWPLLTAAGKRLEI